MHEGEKTGNYTLQIFNCYFFALTIQAVLTRLVADWTNTFTDKTWHLALEGGLSTLSDFYETVSSAQDRQPFMLQIYSALLPGAQWPAEHLISNLKQKLQQLTGVSQACNATLWYSNLELAVDYGLRRRVRDASMSVVKIQSEDLLLELVSQAISRHEQELQMSKLSRVQRHINLFRGFTYSLSALHYGRVKMCNLGFRRPRPDSPQPTPPPMSKAAQIPTWLTWVGMLALWVLQAVLRFFRLGSLGPSQPGRYVLIEDEFEPGPAILNPEHKSGIEMLRLSQKLHSLTATSWPVKWKEWPWDHIYQPIKQHTLKSLLKEEKNVLRVSFSNGADQPMSVSKLQHHLLTRIRLHAERVELFRLGSAARIQDELEDRMSQVWALVRPDDTK
ncbi:hypothetical protein FRC10_010917 [Ceratobasidium sp. 414]|nr:hypothetical protein FRC10_010917 [Ceratobasidium sp. 414]